MIGAANTQLSADVSALMEAGRAVSPGELLSFSVMEEVLGRDVRSRLYIWLQAQRRLEKESGILFANVRGEGYKRLLATEYPHIGVRARQRIRRTAKRAVSAMSEGARRANDMPHDVQKQVHAEISSLKLHEFIASSAAQGAVERATEEATMPLAKTMEALRQHLVG